MLIYIKKRRWTNLLIVAVACSLVIAYNVLVKLDSLLTI